MENHMENGCTLLKTWNEGVQRIEALITSLQQQWDNDRRNHQSYGLPLQQGYSPPLQQEYSPPQQQYCMPQLPLSPPQHHWDNHSQWSDHTRELYQQRQYQQWSNYTREPSEKRIVASAPTVTASQYQQWDNYTREPSEKRTVAPVPTVTAKQSRAATIKSPGKPFELKTPCRETMLEAHIDHVEPVVEKATEKPQAIEPPLIISSWTPMFDDIPGKTVVDIPILPIQLKDPHITRQDREQAEEIQLEKPVNTSDTGGTVVETVINIPESKAPDPEEPLVVNAIPKDTPVMQQSTGTYFSSLTECPSVTEKPLEKPTTLINISLHLSSLHLSSNSSPVNTFSFQHRVTENCSLISTVKPRRIPTIERGKRG
jgi:hypothetical protein